MIHKLIEQYINKLNEEDIINFSNKNGIELTKEELKLVYNYIKNDWKTIIFGNPKPILEDIKSKIEPIKYQKIENLYYAFKTKYENYL